MEDVKKTKKTCRLLCHAPKWPQQVWTSCGCPWRRHGTELLRALSSLLSSSFSTVFWLCLVTHSFPDYLSHTLLQPRLQIHRPELGHCDITAGHGVPGWAQTTAFSCWRCIGGTLTLADWTQLMSVYQKSRLFIVTCLKQYKTVKFFDFVSLNLQRNKVYIII